jgi:hypothetical protein
MFKLPTSFHSSMVSDVPNFSYGDVQTDASFPYPHKGVLTEDGNETPRRLRSRRQEDTGHQLRYSRRRAQVRAGGQHLNLLWIEDMITGDNSPCVNHDIYRDVTHATTTPIYTREQVYLRQNYKHLLESHAVNVIGPDPCDVGGLAEIKWVAEHVAAAHPADRRDQGDTAERRLSKWEYEVVLFAKLGSGALGQKIVKAASNFYRNR